MINFSYTIRLHQVIVHECTLMCNRPIPGRNTFTQKRVPVVPSLRSVRWEPCGSSKFKVAMGPFQAVQSFNRFALECLLGLDRL